MNIREELNKLDQDTFNQYDLFNLYSSISVDKELKEQVVGLIKESKCEELCKLLSEAYEKQTGFTLAESEDKPLKSLPSFILRELEEWGANDEDIEYAKYLYHVEKIKNVEDIEDEINTFNSKRNFYGESLTETYENLPEIEDKVKGVTDQVTAKAVKDHEKKMKNIRKGLKDADAEIKDEPFTSGEHQPKPEEPVVPDLIEEELKEETVDTEHYDLWDEKPYTKKQLLYELNSDKMLEKSKGSFQVGHPDERDLCAEILSDAGYEYEISGDGPWFHFEYWKEENEALEESVEDDYEKAKTALAALGLDLPKDIYNIILNRNDKKSDMEMPQKESLKEDYGWEIPVDKVWDAYDELVEVMGAEGLLLSLAKAMSTEELADNLAYICRMNDLEISSLEDSPERNESLTEDLNNFAGKPLKDFLRTVDQRVRVYLSSEGGYDSVGNTGGEVKGFSGRANGIPWYLADKKTISITEPEDKRFYDYNILIENLKDTSIDESLDENDFSDFNSEFYNKVADILFRYHLKGKDIERDDVEKAYAWFDAHFYDSDDNPGIKE